MISGPRYSVNHSRAQKQFYDVDRRIDVSYLSLPILMIVFGCAGCTTPIDPADSSVDSTLAVVIADLYLADAEFQIRALSDSLDPAILDLQTVSSPVRDSILASHGFTDDEFMTVMEAFIEDPTRYVGLYDRVLDRLNAEKRIIED